MTTEVASFAHRVQVTVPAEALDILERLDLPAQLDEQAQSLLDRRAFGRKTRRRHRRGEQIVVDLDIRPHLHTITRYVYERRLLYTYITAATRQVRPGGGGRPAEQPLRPFNVEGAGARVLPVEIGLAQCRQPAMGAAQIVERRLGDEGVGRGQPEQLVGGASGAP